MAQQGPFLLVTTLHNPAQFKYFPCTLSGALHYYTRDAMLILFFFSFRFATVVMVTMKVIIRCSPSPSCTRTSPIRMLSQICTRKNFYKREWLARSGSRFVTKSEIFNISAPGTSNLGYVYTIPDSSCAGIKNSYSDEFFVPE